MSATHIFLDNSNIFGGAQRAAREKEGVPWQCVRVDYANLFRLLTNGKLNRRTSMLAGSVPPGNEALWGAAQNAGFDTTLLRRVEGDDGRLVEQGVDEAIHLRIGNILLDEDDPGTMVVATGDGRQTEQGCSFTQQVIRAAKRNWNVEVWSWSAQLSPALRNTRLNFPDKIKVIRLDQWYSSIVFLKGGSYNYPSGMQTVITRSCTPMNLTESRFAEAVVEGG